MVNSLTTRAPQCLKMIRLMALDGIKFNRRVFVHYIDTKLNILADSLSRMDFVDFWVHAPSDMVDSPDSIPDDIWPADKIWFNQII